MSRSDQWLTIFVVTVALIHVAAFFTGSVTQKLFFPLAIVNLVSGSSILIYWIQKQLRITQHIFEGREMAVLGLEAVIVFVTAYSLASNHWTSWTRVFQYIVFGIHVIILLLFIIFILTFRMKRLF